MSCRRSTSKYGSAGKLENEGSAETSFGVGGASFAGRAKLAPHGLYHMLAKLMLISTESEPFKGLYGCPKVLSLTCGGWDVAQ